VCCSTDDNLSKGRGVEIMSTRRARTRARRTSGGVPWWIGGAVAVVAIAVAGWLLFPRGGGDAQPAVVTAAKVKGNPAAPIEVEEWSDFQ
jgi:hypothetical protein